MPVNRTTASFIDALPSSIDQDIDAAGQSVSSPTPSTLRLSIPPGAIARELARMFCELPRSKRVKLLDVARSMRLQAELRSTGKR